MVYKLQWLGKLITLKWLYIACTMSIVIIRLAGTVWSRNNFGTIATIKSVD